MDMRYAKGIFTVLFLGAVLLIPPRIQLSTNQQIVQEVDCDAGETLTAALEAAEPGDTIRVTGTCAETVTITTDGLTLVGEGGATIDGGDTGQDVVTIDGALDLTITGFTVQNGAEGILAIHGANFAVSDTIVQNNGSHGIELNEASAEFTNITSHQNGRAGLIIARNSVIALTDSVLQNNLTGLVVFNNATARLFGANVMSQNATQGFTVGLGGVAFSIGSTISVNDNGSEGVLILQDGNVQLIGGTLEANNNGTDGINLSQNSSIILGIAEFGVPGEAFTLDNAGNGIKAATGSDVAASQIMPLTGSGNGGAGVQLDDGASATLNGATLEDNGTADLDLTFGSRATLDGSSIGRISCDRTALLRGDTRVNCPFSGGGG
jgi:hypothetical protein